ECGHVGGPASLSWARTRSEGAPHVAARRHRRERAPERSRRTLGRRAHHADVRALGVLLGRAALRVLPAAREGARSLGPAEPCRSSARAPRARTQTAPALREPRVDRDGRRDAGPAVAGAALAAPRLSQRRSDRKSTRLNSSHQIISYAVF